MLSTVWNRETLLLFCGERTEDKDKNIPLRTVPQTYLSDTNGEGQHMPAASQNQNISFTAPVNPIEDENPGGQKGELQKGLPGLSSTTSMAEPLDLDEDRQDFLHVNVRQDSPRPRVWPKR